MTELLIHAISHGKQNEFLTGLDADNKKPSRNRNSEALEQQNPCYEEFKEIEFYSQV